MNAYRSTYTLYTNGRNYTLDLYMELEKQVKMMHAFRMNVHALIFARTLRGFANIHLFGGNARLLRLVLSLLPSVIITPDLPMKLCKEIIRFIHGHSRTRPFARKPLGRASSFSI